MLVVKDEMGMMVVEVVLDVICGDCLYVNLISEIDKVE